MSFVWPSARPSIETSHSGTRPPTGLRRLPLHIRRAAGHEGPISKVAGGAMAWRDGLSGSLAWQTGRTPVGDVRGAQYHLARGQLWERVGFRIPGAGRGTESVPAVQPATRNVSRRDRPLCAIGRLPRGAGKTAQSAD